jgi:cytochrome c biogenesis protein CcmG, thiol:disulfide interchange protein DsbE
LRAGTKQTIAVPRLAHALLSFLLISPTGLAAPVAAPSLVNKRAPEIARHDLSGQRIALNSLRGHVVLLNFWATWCAPCLVEMPIFSKWQQQYASQGLQVIGISMDDDAAPVRKLVAKVKPVYPIAMGDAKLGDRYGGVMGLPLTYLVDRKGIVRARFQGETDPATIEEEVKLMLDRH